MSPILLAMAIAAGCSGAGEASAPTGTGGIMQKGPDIEEAVRKEYEGLKARNTREGLELFIARHPDHPLADEARREIERRYGNRE
ncbi:hypothetical protein LXM94_14155 [Rhizobium sp. TRM95111]|uniref:hypothetical protein n=1 Tax=Rhizobium alarense TaxID=2846851 RepID=UPI001F30682F|nr:hypothetical protein [Rhizobium alarense]MCF3641115.1 hypothetical protein [Rhizobium alarense]